MRGFGEEDWGYIRKTIMIKFAKRKFIGGFFIEKLAQKSPMGTLAQNVNPSSLILMENRNYSWFFMSLTLLS